ncbi:Lipoprotein [Cupriavidus sp. H18C2]
MVCAGVRRGYTASTPIATDPAMPRLPLLLAALTASIGLAACAPDSFRNYEARGLNSYLDKVQDVCANTRLGSQPLGEWLRSGSDDSDSNYVYWLDQTSRLYYNRITVPQYRDAIAATFGGSKANADALDCIVRNLPADRPTSPPGGMF